MDADSEWFPWPAGVGVRRRCRHPRGAQQGGAASSGVHREPLPEEGIAGPLHAHAGAQYILSCIYATHAHMYAFDTVHACWAVTDDELLSV